MSVSIHSSNPVKRDAAVALLRAYLADFLNNTPRLAGNHILTSHWSDGWLDLALQAVRACDLQRAADALRRAAEEAAEPVIVWPGDTADYIENAQQERERIALAVSVACALLEVATRFSQEGGAA